jgi:hypothetical protein
MQIVSSPRCALALILGFLVATAATRLAAQETIVWSDIDCSQSKIDAPVGPRCRATNVFGTRGAPTSTGGGQVKSWNASGILDQVKLYYFVTEIIDTNSGVKVGTLADDLRSISPQARGVTDMPASERRGDADVVTFVNVLKDNCVGLRKNGPTRGGGYKWVLYATRCTPAARKASDADINAFTARAGFRP